MTDATSAVVAVVVGPQASGKSTLATALAHSLRADGEKVALVELDQIAAMALPTLPGWVEAHRVFAVVVGAWARMPLTCVIAEGSGFADEVDELRRAVPSEAAVVTVAVTVPFDVAFDRALRDPTRGISRDRTFLRRVYDDWRDDLPEVAADVVIDSGQVRVADAVTVVRLAIARARDEPGDSQ